MSSTVQSDDSQPEPPQVCAEHRSGRQTRCRICAIKNPAFRKAVAVDQQVPGAPSQNDICERLREHINDPDPSIALDALVESGLDVRTNGHCALQDFADSPKILCWLLEQGIDANRTDHDREESGFRLYGPIEHSLKVLNNIGATGNIELFDHVVARGADPLRSFALHSVSRCKDPEKTVNMIDHLIDVHHMDVNFDNDSLRDYFDDAPDSGGPLHAAIHHQNLVAVQHLLKRGANANGIKRWQDGYGWHNCGVLDNAIIGRYNSPGPMLSALEPLLDAGASIDSAFSYAVEANRVDAARLCLARGVDPTVVIKVVDDCEASRLAGSPEGDYEAMWELEADDSLPRPEVVQRREEMKELLALLKQTYK
ncbi:hypothetical protein B0A48_05349 [Cryoendolithus antarcticus]|uniref:Uncharacterized protein n=1 Tax=Cryoendolithus antarcticus TaxID=1507870 RepID=A0A1V8TIH4_9PEZI|nr:hypothetical protein B0A48_05349 [Cryoendolithus antarcticus]